MVLPYLRIISFRDWLRLSLKEMIGTLKESEALLTHAYGTCGK